MGQPMIQTIQPGDEIIGFYLLNRVFFRAGKRSLFLDMELQDNSGVIRGVLWDASQEQYKQLEKCRIIKIKARATMYEDKLQLTIEKFRLPVSEDDIPYEMLIEISEKDLEEMKQYLFQCINRFQVDYLKTLLTNIFSDKEIAEKYFTAAAGKKWHHSYRHGLLEHVVNMLHIAETMKGLYPDLNLDLLQSGIILHDIGKIWEYQDPPMMDFTDIGRLHGHIALGYHFVREQIRQINDFPDSLTLELGHLILSHQGELEMGSPVVPMTLEAIVLHYIDELDAKANAITRIYRKDIPTDAHWSHFNPLMNRYFYRREGDF